MNCPVCLNPATAPALTGVDFLFETTTRTFHLSGCPNCRCLFLDPPPLQEEIAEFYPAQYWWKSSSEILKKLEMTYRRAALHDHIAFIAAAAGSVRHRPVRLLDVGCGSGTLLGILKQRGYDVVGQDFSAEAAAIARAENDVEVVPGSLQDAGFGDESFDLVTLFHVMEHVTNPHEILTQVRRILRSNGRIVLQVPNIESWQFRFFGANWYGLDIPRHVIDYSSSSIRKLLGDSGFAVRRVRHFNLRDNAPALASSLFPSLDPVSRAVRQRRRRIIEPAPVAWLRHFLYLGAVVLAYPFALAEAAVGSGATIMIEASRT